MRGRNTQRQLAAPKMPNHQRAFPLQAIEHRSDVVNLLDDRERSLKRRSSSPR